MGEVNKRRFPLVGQQALPLVQWESPPQEEGSGALGGTLIFNWYDSCIGDAQTCYTYVLYGHHNKLCEHYTGNEEK